MGGWECESFLSLISAYLPTYLLTFNGGWDVGEGASAVGPVEEKGAVRVVDDGVGEMSPGPF